MFLLNLFVPSVCECSSHEIDREVVIEEYNVVVLAVAVTVADVAFVQLFRSGDGIITRRDVLNSSSFGDYHDCCEFQQHQWQSLCQLWSWSHSSMVSDQSHPFGIPKTLRFCPFVVWWHWPSSVCVEYWGQVDFLLKPELATSLIPARNEGDEEQLHIWGDLAGTTLRHKPFKSSPLPNHQCIFWWFDTISFNDSTILNRSKQQCGLWCDCGESEQQPSNYSHWSATMIIRLLFLFTFVPGRTEEISSITLSNGLTVLDSTQCSFTMNHQDELQTSPSICPCSSIDDVFQVSGENPDPGQPHFLVVLKTIVFFSLWLMIAQVSWPLGRDRITPLRLPSIVSLWICFLTRSSLSIMLLKVSSRSFLHDPRTIDERGAVRWRTFDQLSLDTIRKHWRCSTFCMNKCFSPFIFTLPRSLRFTYLKK